MKGKPDLIKAARISAAAKKVGGVYVVATRNQQLPQEENASAQIAEYPLAEYSCKECATVFSANEGIAAHCVTCGSHHVECSSTKKVTASKARQATHTDADLNHYACASCGTSNILHSAIIAAAGRGVHCVNCGHENVFANVDDMPPLDSGDTMDDLDLVDTSEGSDDVLDDLSTDLPMDDTVDIDPDIQADAGGLGTNDGALGNEPEALPAEPTLMLDDTSVAPTVEYSEEDDMMDVDMLALDDDTPVEQLSMVWLKDSVAIANSKFHLLATLSAETAGSNADILQTQEFAASVSHTIATQGLIKACKHYGFKPVVARIPMKKVVDAKVEQALATKARELNNKITAVSADFAQATEIAAAGFAKNFWQNVQDPLKAAMVTELSALGVRNPLKLIDRVWALHSPKALAAIIEKAKELSKVSVTARNDLAAALDMVNYKPTVLAAEDDDSEEEDDSDSESDSDEDDSEEEATVESRLAMAATPVRPHVVHSSAQGTTDRNFNGKSTIASILQGRSGHFNPVTTN